MKKLILSLLTLCVFIFSAFAQSDFTKKEIKDLKKVNKLYKKKKYDDAIKLMEPIVMEHKKDQNLWTGLCGIYAERYNSRKLNFTITTESKDEASQKLMESLMLLLSGKKERDEYIDVMRKATLMCGGLEEVGMLLRMEVIDSRYKVDTNISEKGKKHFATAEGYFKQEDMVNAIKYYKKALDADPDYYKAYLYLGDAYYFNKE